MISYRKIVRAAPQPISPQAKRSVFNPKAWKLSRKEKTLIATILIAVILIPAIALLPRDDRAEPQPTQTPIATAAPQATNSTTPKSNPLEDLGKLLQDTGKTISKALSGNPTGPIEGAQTMNSSVWKKVAANAWNYFKPGTGVDGKTGLPWSGSAYPYFTDWDLGVYIQATIEASRLGLINKDGDWGFNDRINRVLTFCETRELDNASYPYWFYQAVDGGVYHQNSDDPNFVVDVADTGRFFVALDNLRTYDPSVATRVNNIVYDTYGNRSDYAALVPGIRAESLTSKSIYTYYAASGFASFWPDQLPNATSKILDNIYSADNVTVNGVVLPEASITSDVLLCLLFETSQNSQLTNLVHQVYLAHENYNKETGKYRAFGEGPTLSKSWVWEWVVLPDGRKWTVLDGENVANGSPTVFTKVAFGFLAVYNTAFAKNMSTYIEHALYSYNNGYGEGVDEIGQQLYTLGSNNNGLILEAARYAIQTRP